MFSVVNAICTGYENPFYKCFPKGSSSSFWMQCDFRLCHCHSATVTHLRRVIDRPVHFVIGQWWECVQRTSHGINHRAKTANRKIRKNNRSRTDRLWDICRLSASERWVCDLRQNVLKVDSSQDSFITTIVGFNHQVQCALTMTACTDHELTPFCHIHLYKCIHNPLMCSGFVFTSFVYGWFWMCGRNCMKLDKWRWNNPQNMSGYYKLFMIETILVHFSRHHAEHASVWDDNAVK